eukprot:TRINITY_DN4032_c1_g3_i1.p1 TRINITY_DN4032_c1_g3~~TRINITY_DN4032_c1_g3_i1.p1  ORF type:complete len:1092 (+),score=248.99 TRINITY_DN4032_c1_g3_i1:158-3433(+)
MQSLGVVSSSLQEDRRRVTLRNSIPALNIDLLQDDTEDADDIKSVRHHFQAAVQKLMAFGWMTERPGIKRNVLERGMSDRWQQAPDDAEKKMLGQILGSWNLMMKSCELLQEFQHELLGIEGFFDELGVSPVSPETGSPRAKWQLAQAGSSGRLDSRSQKIMDLAVRVIHQVKWSSLRVCYHKVIEKLDRELRDLKGKHEELQEQFQKIRLEYLQEVAALRDQVRVRGDVEHVLDAKTDDIVYYFEPTKALTAVESEFVLNTVKEKILMILEANPRVAPSVDMGQMEKLREMCETKMVGDLKKSLVDKANELKEMKRVMAMMLNPDSKTKAGTKLLEVKDRMIVVLEEKVSDLRCDTLRLQEELKVEKARSTAAIASQEYLREECRETHDALKDSEMERMTLLARTDSLQMHAQEVKESEGELISRERQLNERLKAAQRTNEGLARILQRLRWAYGDQNSALLNEEERNQLKLLESVLLPSSPPSPKSPVSPRPMLPKGVRGADVHPQPVFGAAGPTSLPSEENLGGSAVRPLGASREELAGLLDDAHEQLQESWKTSDGHLSRIHELQQGNLRLQEALWRQSEGLLVMDSQPFDTTYYADLLLGKIQEESEGRDVPADPFAAVAWGSSSSSPAAADSSAGGVSLGGSSSEALQAQLQEAIRRADASAEALKKVTEGEVTDKEKAIEIRQHRVDCLKEQVDLEFQCLGAQLQEAMADWQASNREQEQVCSCGASKAAAHFKALSLRLLGMLKQLGRKTQSVSSENLQLRQDLLAMSSSLKDATQTLKTSKAISGDHSLQRALTSLDHASETHVPAVFDRLYKNTSSKESRILELRDQHRAELMKSAVLHLVKGAVQIQTLTTCTVMDSQPEPEMELPYLEQPPAITVQALLPQIPRQCPSLAVPKQESQLPRIATGPATPPKPSDTDESVFRNSHQTVPSFSSAKPREMELQMHTVSVTTHSLQVNDEPVPIRSPSRRSPHNMLQVTDDSSSLGSRSPSKQKTSKQPGKLKSLDDTSRKSFARDTLDLQVNASPLSARSTGRRHTETSLQLPLSPQGRRASHMVSHILESSGPAALASHSLVAQGAGRRLH